MPALESFLATSSNSGSGSAKSLLASLTPFFGQLVPVFDYLGAYRKELAAFFANDAASTEGAAPAFSSNARLHYLRFASPLSPEELTAQSQRPTPTAATPTRCLAAPSRSPAPPTHSGRR